MGKYKYIVGVEDDAQSGQVLCCKAQDRKAAAVPGEATDMEDPEPEQRRPRSRMISVESIPKKFAPEKLTVVESASST